MQRCSPLMLVFFCSLCSGPDRSCCFFFLLRYSGIHRSCSVWPCVAVPIPLMLVGFFPETITNGKTLCCRQSGRQWPETEMSLTFKRCAWWQCDECKIADLLLCPVATFECVDDGPEEALMNALHSGQRHGYVNHWEQHIFEILDVDADVGGHTLAIVFSVLHEERRVYVFQEVKLSFCSPQAA